MNNSISVKIQNFGFEESDSARHFLVSKKLVMKLLLCLQQARLVGLQSKKLNVDLTLRIKVTDKVLKIFLPKTEGNFRHHEELGKK